MLSKILLLPVVAASVLHGANPTKNNFASESLVVQSRNRNQRIGNNIYSEAENGNRSFRGSSSLLLERHDHEIPEDQYFRYLQDEAPTAGPTSFPTSQGTSSSSSTGSSSNDEADSEDFEDESDTDPPEQTPDTDTQDKSEDEDNEDQSDEEMPNEPPPVPDLDPDPDPPTEAPTSPEIDPPPVPTPDIVQRTWPPVDLPPNSRINGGEIGAQVEFLRKNLRRRPLPGPTIEERQQLYREKYKGMYIVLW